MIQACQSLLPSLGLSLDVPGVLVRLAGVHDTLGARLAQEAGFDGVWVSSLAVATSHGAVDDGSLGPEAVLCAASEIAARSSLPVIADAETGFGGPAEVSRLVERYAQAGVAGVCIQDSALARRNSLLPGRHLLAARDEFAARLRAACRARSSHGMLLLARVEALVAGMGQAEALDRARVYADTGADLILIHSRSSSPEEVLTFAEAWCEPIPLAVVPTAYPALTIDRVRQIPQIRMVIYANHALRAAIAAIRHAFREILDAGTSLPAENWIAGLSDVFALAGGEDQP